MTDAMPGDVTMVDMSMGSLHKLSSFARSEGWEQVQEDIEDAIRAQTDQAGAGVVR